jgi:hypothetical protein
MPLIRLSDDELTAVFAAARPLAVHQRDAFLRQVADELRHCNGDVGPGDVFRAIKAAQRSHFDPPQIGNAGTISKYR